MKSVLLVLVLLALAFAASDRRDFIEFQRKYNRVYSSQAEFEKRFQIFQDNMKWSQELTAANHGSARFGATKFSDLSKEEFASLYLMKNFTKSAYLLPPTPKTAPKVGGPDPTNYDWQSAGVITPVYDQGQCGSCWAFSATETIESYYALAGNTLTKLSIEQIVDCDISGNDEGCNGGFPSGAYTYIQSAGGIDSGSSYPYTAGGGQGGTCSFNSQNVVTNVGTYTSVNGESGLYSQASTAGPVSVCVDASTWQNYQSGILTTCTNSIDHCVQLTGYENYGGANAAWHVRNSWNTNWGENGYIRIAIGQDLCCIGDEATVVTVTAPSTL